MATPVKNGRVVAQPTPHKQGPSAGQLLLEQTAVLKEMRSMMHRLLFYGKWCCFTACLIAFILLFPLLVGSAVFLAVYLST